MIGVILTLFTTTKRNKRLRDREYEEGLVRGSYLENPLPWEKLTWLK